MVKPIDKKCRKNTNIGFHPMRNVYQINLDTSVIQLRSKLQNVFSNNTNLISDIRSTAAIEILDSDKRNVFSDS